MEHLFVYGSLRKGTDKSKAQRKGVGSEYARYLEMHGTYVGAGKAEGRLWVLSDYPGFTDGKGIVLGDLYQVTTSVIKKLDAWEGHEFERLKRPVDGPDGEVDAWVYVYRFSPTGKTRILNGDWSSYGSDTPAQAAATAATAAPPAAAPAAEAAPPESSATSAEPEVAATPAPAAAKKASKKSASK
jgi:gamma-glutamylcyclotransferase (GGCT)/AIG2-like uncharacterized protein YtfP